VSGEEGKAFSCGKNQKRCLWSRNNSHLSGVVSFWEGSHLLGRCPEAAQDQLPVSEPAGKPALPALPRRPQALWQLPGAAQWSPQPLPQRPRAWPRPPRLHPPPRRRSPAARPRPRGVRALPGGAGLRTCRARPGLTQQVLVEEPSPTGAAGVTLLCGRLLVCAGREKG